MFKEHRITSRSRKVGQPWIDQNRYEWQRYTCGVTGHDGCKKVIAQKTGNRLEK